MQTEAEVVIGRGSGRYKRGGFTEVQAAIHEITPPFNMTTTNRLKSQCVSNARACFACHCPCHARAKGKQACRTHTGASGGGLDATAASVRRSKI